MVTIDLSQAIAGCERLERRLRSIEGFYNYAKPLMQHWERIAEENNRYKVLSGIDKDGNPAPDLTYRLTFAQRRANYAGAKPVKLTIGQRLGQRGNFRRGREAGIGKYTEHAGILENNNLTTAAYKLLDGPRLAPRRQFSRVITNFRTTSWQDDDPTQWRMSGAWVEVVSVKGEHFLHFHFDGNGQKKYDLRGLTTSAVSEARAAIVPWAKLTIRELYIGTK